MKKTVKLKEKGISVTLISRRKLESLTTEEKIDYIIGEISKGKILVLENGLTPVEQTALIEQTMAKIDHDTFIGIEMEGYADIEDENNFLRRIIQKFFGIIKKPRMTVIGPANLLKTVYKDNNVIQTMIITGRGAK
jgi:hypothetical protein